MTRWSSLWVAAFLLLSVSLGNPAMGGAGVDIVFVNASATGANDGSTWDNAFTSLATAITAAPFDSEIWVAAGTYKPTTSSLRVAAFSPRFGQKIFGGFAGGETERDQRDIAANLTILSGDIGTAGVDADNTFHVVTFPLVLPDTRVLDGFTVEDGEASGFGTFPSRGGGVVVFDDAAPLLENLIVRRSNATVSGGGVHLRGPASLKNVQVLDSRAPDGGGVSIEGADFEVTFENTTVEGNVATDSGGGLLVVDGSVIIHGGTFVENVATNGGGISVEANGVAAIDGTTFERNNASNSGGAGSNDGTLTVTNATFESNTAQVQGGALRLAGGHPTTVSSSQFTRNTATADAGAILTQDTPVTISDSTFTRNNVGGISTDGLGGAIATFTGNLSISGGAFVLNTTGDSGGAISFEEGLLTITGAAFDRNSTRRDDGGALFAQGSAVPTVVTVTDATFTSNTSPEDGGAIEAFVQDAGDELKVTGSTFTNNAALEQGGAIHTTGLLTIVGSTFEGNEAETGGAVRSQGTVSISLSAFTGNQGIPGARTVGAALTGDTVNLSQVSFTTNSAVSTTLPAVGSAVVADTVEGDGVTFESNSGAAALATTSAFGVPASRLVNATFSDNHGGAILVGRPDIALNNVTLAGNDTADHAAVVHSADPTGKFSARNSIFWDNGPAAIDAIAGDTIDLSTIEGGCPAAASCAGIVADDPLLKPLADRGGPTRTHGLSLGSPAIDSGDNATCEAKDQRGANRPIDGDGDSNAVCDMGAYEVGPTSIGFAKTSSAVNESAARVRIPVVLGTALTETATVRFRVTGGSATSGKDFVLAAGTLTFPAGTTSKAIIVALKDDLFVEPVEKIVITLDRPTGALLSTSRHTLSITDNERRLRCDGVAATIVGTASADTITGTPKRDVVVALGGADTVKTLGGDDIVCAGGGNDRVRTAAGDDKTLGGRGSDEVFGGGGDDEVSGEAGTDRLFGDRGNDRLAGGPGAGDRCDGGPDTDALPAGHGCEVVVAVP